MTTPRLDCRILDGLLAAGLLLCSFVCPLDVRGRDLKEVEVYMTAEDGPYHLANRGFRAFEPLDQPDESYPTIMIDLDKTFQTIEGFGGAFTDAAAITFLNPDGKVAVVILNLKDTEQFFQLWVGGKAAKYTSPARAIITMVL